MKESFGFGLILIIVAFYGRSSGRLSQPVEMRSFTANLIEHPSITTGKYSKIILSLSYERSRFMIDDNAEAIIYSNPVSLRKVNSLKKGDQVTVWFSDAAEPGTHSYLNTVSVFGLAIGSETIVYPEQTNDKNRREFRWMLIVGMAISALAGTVLVVRKVRSLQ